MQGSFRNCDLNLCCNENQLTSLDVSNSTNLRTVEL